jgi:hypothetical protein
VEIKTTPFKDLLVNINLVNADIDRFNKKLGLTGYAAQGVVSAFEGLGLKGLSKTIGLDDALVKMKEMAQFQADRQKAEEELYNLNERGLSASQIRAGFGGKELKEKQLLLDKLNDEAKVIGANAGNTVIFLVTLQPVGSAYLT